MFESTLPQASWGAEPERDAVMALWRLAASYTMPDSTLGLMQLSEGAGGSVYESLLVLKTKAYHIHAPN